MIYYDPLKEIADRQNNPIKMADTTSFTDLNEDEINKFLSDQRNKNTTKKAATDI